ncbi:c-type cytochrome [Trinickia fusca]|uniref:Cytochrome C n=1 Tax=Trinickia fusca TaxID=2419777 RepID=A0A494XBS2_9BURK|nr:c-type cytochrome [Trinickia fusca]RKP48205.1 cytochrome C [Trinickia fusca]
MNTRASIRFALAAAITAIVSALPHLAHAQTTLAPAAQTQAAAVTRPFAPPPESSMPATGDFGATVRLGQQIFLHTGELAGKYVGNSLNCASCHLDAGRKADSGPLWAAYVSYPAWRSKDGKVSTLAERMQGCFLYSMNGKAPPANDPLMVALETYAFWLAQGAPVGGTLSGRGYPKLPAPAQVPDYARGGQVYAQHCALCHGDDGQGQTSHGETVFPPLWGPRSFNWGAGMHELQNASAFIKANMPLGLGGTLTDQEAWDVAKFMDSHERPQDPRFTGSVETTRTRYHDSPWSMYGRTVNGHVLGSQ